MADVNATFNYDANFGSALSQIKALSKELSVLNNSFNSLDKNARVLRNDIANTFTSAVGQIGGFSSKTVTITSDLDNFGKALDRSKLKLRDYYREAGRAFSANSNARKLAEDQVRRTKGQLVELGMDAEGRRKGILVTPMKLDMTDMNNQLQVARKQFDIFNRLIQDGATSLINWGKNTQWAGRQLTVGLTVPMTIFASTTIKAFNDVDKELTRFQKVYGADLVGTTKEASMEMRNAIQSVAIDIAKSYGIAAKETAALAADLAATGLEGKKLVDSVKQTSRLAVLGELDRQDAMQTTLSLQNAFNMSTKELAESIDFLNAVENQTSVSLQDLTTAIPKVGPVMQSLGGDVKDLAVLLVAMKEGGINAAESANALKSGLASLINPTKAGSAVAKQYGIDLQGIVTRNKGQLMPTLLEFQASLSTLDDFGKAKIIEQLFGKYQFARISALFDNLNAQGSQTVEVMKLMGASSEELAKIADSEIKTLTESTSMRFQRAMEGIKAALLPVGETITRAVIPFMEKFADLIGRIVEIGKGLPEPVKNFLKFAAGLTAIAGPVVMITGVLANFLGYVTKGAMGFVNLGRRLAGLPTKQFSLLDDTQIAAAKSTDMLTVSIQNQATAMTRLVALMRDYNSTLIAQRAATPGAFSSTPLVRGTSKTRGPIRRQEGSWVPGSGSGDKVKALLEPGEFVVNRNAAKQYGGVLEDMNNGTPRFQSGGLLKARRGIRVRGSYAAPVGIKNQTNKSPLWNTYQQEIDDIISTARKSGNPLSLAQIKELENSVAAHIRKRTGTKFGTKWKIWNPKNIIKDSQWLNNYLQNNKIFKTMDSSRQSQVASAANRNYGIPQDEAINIIQGLLKGVHPTSKKEAQILLEIAKLDKTSKIYGGAQNLIPALERRISGNFYSTIEDRGYSGKTYYVEMTQGTAQRDPSLKYKPGGAGGGGKYEQVAPVGTMSLGSQSQGVKMQSGGVIRAQNGGLIRARRGIKTPKPSQHQQSALQEYWQNPKSAHTESKGSVFRNLLEGYVSQGIIPRGSQLFRALSPEDSKIMQSNAGNLFAPSVRSTTTDKKDAFEVASGARDLGSGSQSVSSVARIIANRKTSGIDMGEALPFTKPKDGDNFSMKEVLLSPTDLYTVGKISRKIVSDGQSSRVMEYLMTTSKPTTIERMILGTLFKLTKLNPKKMNLKNIAPPESQYVGGKSPEARALLEAKQQEAFARGDFGVQTGGIIRAQEGVFVPGSGDGDRVPALLEPGEFVVNKKAAKQHGGLLHDINFNQAPRFQSGGMAGAKMGAVGGAMLSASFLAPMVGVGEGMQKLIMVMGTLTSVVSALQVLMVKNTAAQAAGGAGGLLQRGATNRASGAAQISGRASSIAAGPGASRIGQIAGGVGKYAMGALMSGPGIAVAAGVALAAAAWMKYKKEVNEAKKATQEAYSVGQKTAQAYGYELTQIGDKIKENAQLTKDLGIGFTQTTNTAVSEEKKTAIKEDNANLIADLKENEKRLVESSVGNDSFDQNATKVKSQLITKYATLRQQGVSVEDADEIITTIARETGDETLSILSNLRPQLEQMNSDNVNEVFQAAQQAQLDALKAQNEFGVGGPVGATEAFKEAMKGSMAVIQYAPPEDQLSALNNLINNMRDFSADQVVRGAEALKEAAAAAYGTKSGMGATLEQLFGTTAEDGSTKTEDQQQQDLVLGTRIMNAEQQGIINESQQRIISVALAEGDLERVNSILDEVERNRNVKVNIDIQNKEAAEAALKDLDKQITAQQAKFDQELIANENAVEAENKRYENAQKASEKFIKQKQDEIEAIDKSADAYIKALQDEQRADDFANQQRDTAVGGLKSLASGDVFGFVQSQQEMAGAAQEFGFESEIKAIDERRKAAVDAKQEEIEKEQELAALADERHQAKLEAIQAQRDALVAANATEMKSLQDQQGAWSSLSTMSGGAFDTMMGGYSKAASEAGKVVAVQIAIEQLAKGKTIEEAIAAGQAYMKQTYGVQNSNGGEASSAYTTTGNTAGNTGSGVSPTSGGESKAYASGGYISGAGGPKADLIPARLSNGEYVVQASAVDQYGVGMMDAINEQKFAGGGIVKPIQYGANKGYPYGDNGHLGTDFSGPSGASVVAAHSGNAESQTIKMDPNGINSASNPLPGRNYGDGLASYGRLVTITGNGWKTKYAHLGKILKTGNVNQGETIALSGNSGNSTGAHLHFEVFKGGRRVNPLSAISGGFTGPTGTQEISESDTQLEASIGKIATAMGTTEATYNKVMNEGVASLVGRRFGGSMTMNKPYMVGENGPEIVMPYGSGGKVVPIKYNVPAMASGGIINGSMASSSPQINVTVNGVNDPKQAADRAAQLINSEMNRRKFSRSIG
jgi:TP901 family phage tail tape measure protein